MPVRCRRCLWNPAVFFLRQDLLIKHTHQQVEDNDVRIDLQGSWKIDQTSVFLQLSSETATRVNTASHTQTPVKLTVAYPSIGEITDVLFMHADLSLLRFQPYIFPEPCKVCAHYLKLYVCFLFVLGLLTQGNVLSHIAASPCTNLQLHCTFLLTRYICMRGTLQC